MTIAKNLSFVIFLLAVSGLLLACGSTPKSEKTRAANPNFGPPTVVGTIRSKDITESSGVAASRCQSNILWTHNDSGNDAYIFAIDSSGKVLGTYLVKDAKNKDWEDIAGYKDAAGKCFIYIGDIGDNDAKRATHEVYRVLEPMITPAGADSNKKHPLDTDPAQVVRFSYPDRNQNAETLMVQPSSGDIYVLTKHETGPSGVYKIKPAFDTADPQTAEKVGEVSVPSIPNGLLTGGDISPDGRHAVVCDYSQGYELTLPDGAASFDDIWKQSPQPVDLGKRPHGESVGYNVDGTSVIATSERDDSPVIEVKRRQ